MWQAIPPVGREDSNSGVAAGQENPRPKAWPRIYTEYTHLRGHICEDSCRSVPFLERSAATTAEAAAGEASATPTESAPEP